MANNNNKRYILPAGDAFTEDMACLIVHYPNKDEYRRALMGSLHFLSTWMAWEMDAEKRAKDAARAWKIANDMTMECEPMANCFEDVIQAIKDLQIKVQLNVDCFCGSVAIDPPIPDVTDVPPNSGFPDTYGGVEITTEEQYRRAVCHAANLYVDKLKQQTEQLIDLLNFGSISVGIIAAILAVIASGGLIIIIEYGLAVAIFTGLVNLGTYTFLSDVPEAFETNRATIVEAIVCGYDLGAVVQSIIDEDAWLLFFQFVDWDTAAASVRSGSIDGQNQPYGQSEDCDGMCPDQSFTIQFTFVDGLQNWAATSGVTWMSDDQNVRVNVNGSAADARIELGIDTLKSLLFLDPSVTLTIDRLSVAAYSDGLTIDADVAFSLVGTGGGLYATGETTVPIGGSVIADYTSLGWIADDDSDTIWLRGVRNGASSGNFIRVDDVIIEGSWAL